MAGLAQAWILPKMSTNLRVIVYRSNSIFILDICIEKEDISQFEMAYRDYQTEYTWIHSVESKWVQKELYRR